MADNSITRVAETIAKLTPDGYEAGAQRVVAANEAMVAAGSRVEQSTVQITRSQVVGASTLDRLQAKYDDLFRVEQKYASQLDTLTRLKAQGVDDDERVVAVMARVTAARDADIKKLTDQRAGLIGAGAAAQTGGATVVSASERAGGALDRMAKSASLVNQTLGAFGISLGVQQLIQFTRETIETVGGLGELSIQLGVSTDKLQVLRYAASQSHVTQQELEQGFLKLSRQIGAAANQNDEANLSFRRLGVGILDSSGRVRDAGSVAIDLAAAISRIPDPARRAAAAYEQFGKGGQRLLSMFEDGAAGMAKFDAAARRLGLVLHDDVIDRFKAAGDSIAAFGQRGTVAWAGVIDHITQHPIAGALEAAGIGALVGGAAGFAFGGPGGALVGTRLGGLVGTSGAAFIAMLQQVDDIRKLQTEAAKLTDEITTTQQKLDTLEHRAASLAPSSRATTNAQIGRQQEVLLTDTNRLFEIQKRLFGTTEGSPALLGAATPLGTVGPAPSQSGNPALQRVVQLDAELAAMKDVNEAYRNNSFGVAALEDRIKGLNIVHELKLEADSTEGKQIIDRVVAIGAETRERERSKTKISEQAKAWAELGAAQIKQEEDERKGSEATLDRRDKAREAAATQIQDGQTLIEQTSLVTLKYNDLTGAFELNSRELERRQLLLQLEKSGLPADEAKAATEQLLDQADAMKRLNELQARIVQDSNAAAQQEIRIWENAGDNIQDSLSGSVRDGILGNKTDLLDAAKHFFADLGAQISTAFVIRPILAYSFAAAGAPQQVLSNFGLSPYAVQNGGAGAGINPGDALSGANSVYQASQGQGVFGWLGRQLGLNSGSAAASGANSLDLGSGFLTGGLPSYQALNVDLASQFGNLSSAADSLFSVGGSLESTVDIFSSAIAGASEGVTGLAAATDLLAASAESASAASGGLFAAMGLGPEIAIPVAIAAVLFGSKLFGGKTSVGPGGSAIVGVNQAGVNSIQTTGDNNYDPAGLASNVRQVGDLLRSVATQLGGTLGQTNIGIDQNAPGAGGGFRWWSNIVGFMGEGHSGTFDDAAQAAMVAALKAGAVQGLGDTVNTALRGSKATDLQGLLGDADFADKLDQAVQAIGETGTAFERAANQASQAMAQLGDRFQAVEDRAAGLGVESQALTVINDQLDKLLGTAARGDSITQAEQALAAIQGRFDGLADLFTRFGRDTGGVETARGQAVTQFVQGYNDALADQILGLKDAAALQKKQEEDRYATQLEEARSINADLEQVQELHRQKLLDIDKQANDAAQQQAKQAAQDQQQTIDKLRTLSTSLRDYVTGLAFNDNSPLSPRDKYDAAYNAYQEAQGSARAGDVSAIQALPNIANAFLQASQGYFANTLGYVQDFQGVRASLSSLSSRIDDTVGRGGEMINFAPGSAFGDTLTLNVGAPVSAGFASLTSVANDSLTLFRQYAASDTQNQTILINEVRRLGALLDAANTRLAAMGASFDAIATRPQGRRQQI
jgi:hypothetical protein